MTSPTSTSTSPAERPGPSAWLLRSPEELPRPFGVSGEERLRRALAQAGVAEISTGEAPDAARVVGFRCDRIFDARLVRALVESDDTVLVDDTGVPVAVQVGREAWPRARALLTGAAPPPGELRTVRADELVSAYDPQLRRRSPALLAPLRGADPRALERRLFDASYKGITDFVTRYVWPAPALWAVRRCADAGLSPNAVTAASWLLTIVALLLFAAGRFEIGLLAAWTMTFLDTVDGKLARVTLRSSRIGHVLDHGLDLLHPPFWYAAWAWALPSAPWLATAVWVTLAGYWVHRGIEGLFLLRFGIEIHSWRPVDARFRLVTTRRNPNLVLLTLGTALGSPAAGFAAVAVWTAASIAFHLVRLGRAGIEARAGRPVRSWYAEPAPGGGTPPGAAEGRT